MRVSALSARTGPHQLATPYAALLTTASYPVVLSCPRLGPHFIVHLGHSRTSVVAPEQSTLYSGSLIVPFC